MINFPDNPVDGTTYSYGGVSYIYNETPGIWIVYDSSCIPESSCNSLLYKVHVGVTAPLQAVTGTLWYNTSCNAMLIYIDDGDSAQWIQV